MLKAKTNIIILLIVAAVFLSGCVSVKVSDKEGGGGMFRSLDKGGIWEQKVIVPTASGRPASIANLNTQSLAMDPQDSRTLYFGSENSGLFLTYDNGENWQAVSGLPQATIRAVAVDPQAKCVIYAALNNKIYKSTDCSRSWEEIYSDNDPDVKIESLAVDHYNSAIIYAGLSRGDLLKSSNRGLSWDAVKRFSESVLKIVLDPRDSRKIFALIKNNGLARSLDSGGDWVEVKDKLKELDATGGRDFIISTAQDGLIFLATKSGLLKSADGGENWEAIELVTPSDESSINAVAVGPKNTAEIYYSTDTTFYRSFDAGRTWNVKKLPTTRAGWLLLIDPVNPDIIYLGTRKVK